MAKVSVSTRISAPADEVWRLVGGWNALPDWHPAVEKSEIEQGGHLRRLRLADGSEITERLEKLDSGERTYTYSITACALPLTNYRSTITVRAEGDASAVEWSTNFEPSGAPEADVVKSLSDFYQAGFDNLGKLLRGQ
jgi:uncharacterized protein YndB with AHSA1/START domain